MAVQLNNFDTNRDYLSSDKTMELIRKYRKTGEKRYKDQIVEGNLGLVLSCVKGKDDQTELFQVGCMGLVEAVERFNPKYGSKFSTFAIPTIKGRIKRYIRDNKGVGRKYSVILSAYNQYKKYYPGKSKQKILKLMEVDKSDLVHALNCKHQDSLNREIYNDEGSSTELMNFVQSGQFEDDIADRLTLNKMVSKLTKRKQKIINWNYIDELSQREISERLGVSQAQVSRLLKQAQIELKSYYEEAKMMSLSPMEKKVKESLEAGQDINCVTEEEQKMLELRFVEDETYKAIAEKMNKSQSTIYNYIQDALNKITTGEVQVNQSDNEEEEGNQEAVERVKPKVEPVIEAGEDQQDQTEEDKQETEKQLSDYVLLLIYKSGETEYLESTAARSITRACELFKSQDDVEKVVPCKKLA